MDASAPEATPDRTEMPPSVASAFAREMTMAEASLRERDFDRAFTHLERAHILGQTRTRLHLRAHAAMLRLGWRRRDGREVLGQVFRFVTAALFTHVWIPLGNTGGSRVSAFQPMPLPPDLAQIIAADEHGH